MQQPQPQLHQVRMVQPQHQETPGGNADGNGGGRKVPSPKYR